MKLTEAERKARNEYHRKWREKNKDKVEQHRKTFYAKQARQLQEQSMDQ